MLHNQVYSQLYKKTQEMILIYLVNCLYESLFFLQGGNCSMIISELHPLMTIHIIAYGSL